MMRITLVLMATLILMISSSCSNNDRNGAKEKNAKIEVTETFDWLLGNWERKNDKEGEHTFENWKKITSEEYEGFGWTIRNNDTIFQEEIKLSKSKEGWIFGVISPEETEYTIFKVTHIGDESFTCENPEIEFPGKIKYWRDGKEIKALVSGKDMEIAFEFKKTISE